MSPPNSMLRWTLSFTASSGPGLNDLVGSEMRMPIMPRSPRFCGVTLDVHLLAAARERVRSVGLLGVARNRVGELRRAASSARR